MPIFQDDVEKERLAVCLLACARYFPTLFLYSRSSASLFAQEWEEATPLVMLQMPFDFLLAKERTRKAKQFFLWVWKGDEANGNGNEIIGQRKA